jgi:hypothetical protein
MKTIQYLKTPAFKNRGSVLIAVLGLTLSLIPPGFAQQHSFIIDLDSKRVTDLGSLGGGETHANAINDAGSGGRQFKNDLGRDSCVYDRRQWNWHDQGRCEHGACVQFF